MALTNRRSHIVVNVEGKPVTEQDFTSYNTKVYRVQNVGLELRFASGNWGARWTATGCLIKKDGTVGTATARAPYNFTPAAQTQREFLDTAFSQVVAASNVATR